MAKRARELAVKERRERKRARKAEAAAQRLAVSDQPAVEDQGSDLAEAGESTDTEQEDVVAPAGPA
jgi:hypothetical protein